MGYKMTDLLAGVKLFNDCYKELLKMNDIKDRAREYLAEHSEYSEVFGQTFIAVDTLTAMVEFSKQETKEISDRINKAKEIIERFLKFYERIPRELYCKEFQNLLKDAEKFLKEIEK